MINWFIGSTLTIILCCRGYDTSEETKTWKIAQGLRDRT